MCSVFLSARLFFGNTNRIIMAFICFAYLAFHFQCILYHENVLLSNVAMPVASIVQCIQFSFFVSVFGCFFSMSFVSYAVLCKIH